MRRKFILTIDSGGIRSIIPAVILVELERRLVEAGKTAGLHQYFDLVSGSGLGALMVAALTCPHPTIPGRMVATPSDILALLKSESSFVFASEAASEAAHGPYSAEQFDEGLRAYVGAGTMLPDLSAYIVIPVFDLQRRAPALLSNVEAGKGNFYLWQAVRSGCAVPGYFAPAMVENLAKARPRGTPLMPLIHGGSISNDPSLAAYVEASKLGWIGRDHDAFILSLGAGLDRRPIDYLNAIQSGNHGPGLASVTPSQVNRGTELDDPTPYQLNTLINRDAGAFNGTATRVTPENREQLRFFRINGTLHHASADMDFVSPENIRRLEADAERFIADNSVALDLVVAQLGSDNLQPTSGMLQTTAALLSHPAPPPNRRRHTPEDGSEVYQLPAPKVPVF